ncbi:MAG: hypothetical protein Kow00114_36020 [Kiloniellaceae bacterium]
MDQAACVMHAFAIMSRAAAALREADGGEEAERAGKGSDR